ncbi:MAG: apolipoprotein N-acyltransferase [Verrucomicrobiota bacterium]|jgi:apolipoprotein N-acyltransferase
MDGATVMTKRLGRWALVVLSGVALSWAFPGKDWGIVAWFALLPLMAVLWTGSGKRRKRCGFGYGYLFGAAFFCCNLSWLSTVSSLGVVVLSAYLAIYPALWGLLLRRWLNPWAEQAVAIRGRVALRSLGLAFAHGALWAALECMRGWMLTGFGWNGLGVAMHDQPVMAQCADLFGVAGLSGLMVFFQSVLLQVGRRMIAETKQGRRRAHPDFGIAALLVAAVFVYGVWRLSSENKKESLPMRVCLVQLNVPQVAARQLWTAEEIHIGYEEEVEKAMQAVEQRNQQALEKSAQTQSEADLFYADWLILPEVALTGRLMSAPSGEYAMWQQNELSIDWFRQQGDFDILLGMGELEAVVDGRKLSMPEDPMAWNSLVVLPRSAPLQRYQKRHLVMFGEYIPLLEQLPWLKRIYEQQAGTTFDGAFSAGTAVDPMPMMVRDQKISVIPSICFEDTVPRETRQFVRNEPQVIVNVTNDGWFARSAAAAQHFANAKFRAIELRRPMVRCANTGVSGVISTTGFAQTLKDENGSHFTRGHLLATAKVPLNPTATLYQKWGDWPVYLAAIVSLLGMVGIAFRTEIAKRL